LAIYTILNTTSQLNRVDMKTKTSLCFFIVFTELKINIEATRLEDFCFHTKVIASPHLHGGWINK